MRNNHLPKRKHHLVLLNPYSGRGKASQIFHQCVKPMFTEAEMDYELVVTGKLSLMNGAHPSSSCSKFKRSHVQTLLSLSDLHLGF